MNYCATFKYMVGDTVCNFRTSHKVFNVTRKKFFIKATMASGIDEKGFRSEIKNYYYGTAKYLGEFPYSEGSLCSYRIVLTEKVNKELIINNNFY